MNILKKIFGPSKRDIWKKIANHYRGQFVKGKYPYEDYVNVRIGNWDLIMDTMVEKKDNDETEFTRVIGPFSNDKFVDYSIERKGAFEFISKHFRKDVIELQDEEFNENFLLKGNDEYLVNWIFDSPPVKRSLYAIKRFHFSVENYTGVFGYDSFLTHELVFLQKGNLKDFEQLQNIFDAMALILDKTKEA